MLVITGTMEDLSFTAKRKEYADNGGKWETTFFSPVGSGEEVTLDLDDYQLASCLYLGVSGGDSGEGLPETVEDIWKMAEAAVGHLPNILRIIP